MATTNTDMGTSTTGLDFGFGVGHREMVVTEARRYPEDDNGIIAGDPANNRVRLHMNGYWAYEVTHADPASYIPPAKLPMINRACKLP